MKQVLITYAVIVQVVAVLLLQWYAIAPHFRQGNVHQCRGDHSQCGCAPERIAAHTCCCYQRKALYCGMKNHCKKSHFTKRSGNSSITYIGIAPCGGNPKFITVSLDRLEFVRSKAQTALPTRCSFRRPTFLRETVNSRIMEPPDPPPPKKLLFS